MGINPLKILGKVGKGLATVAGLTGAAATTVVLDPGLIGVPSFDLNETLRLVLEVIRALSALLAAAGFGRKTGYAAAPDGQR